MTLPNGRNGQLLALGLTALVLALVWLGAVRPLTEWYSEQADALALQQAVALRLTRLAATLPALREEAAATLTATPAAASLVELLEGETDGIAAANLQARLQDLAATTGTSFTSVEMLPVEGPGQPLPGKPVNTDRAVRLRVMLDAPWPKLMALLDRIKVGPPLMLIDDLRLESSRHLLGTADSPLQAGLTVTGFRQPGAAAAAGRPGATASATNP
jgi:general secretion pathway protein M